MPDDDSTRGPWNIESSASDTLHFFLYIHIYINYIIRCKIKKDNQQVPKIIRVPGNKTNPKKIKKKITNNAISYYNNYKIYWFKPCLKIFCFHSKRGSSNLLVEIIYSTVALRTFVLAFRSNELLPNRRILIKTGSQKCRRLLSMFFMVLRRVSFSNIHGTAEEKVRSCFNIQTTTTEWV